MSIFSQYSKRLSKVCSSDMSMFYVQVHMSKNVVQEVIPRDYVKGNVLACISKVYFLLEVRMSKE